MAGWAAVVRVVVTGRVVAAAVVMVRVVMAAGHVAEREGAD